MCFIHRLADCARLKTPNFFDFFLIFQSLEKNSQDKVKKTQDNQKPGRVDQTTMVFITLFCTPKTRTEVFLRGGGGGGGGGGGVSPPPTIFSPAFGGVKINFFFGK